MKFYLLIIDPQFDFCSPEGSLYVTGAHDDMKRLATMIKKCKSFIDKIYVTLDEHNTIHIAHPVFWRDSQGKNPQPFTLILSEDLRTGKWVTAKPEMFEKAFSYVSELEKRGKFNLCIWPPHCIKGSLGATIIPELHEAIQSWEMENWTVAEIITKGENIWTEHYSAIKAEVPDPEDPKTDVNISFIDKLKSADLIGIAGEALSHCVANTVKDIAEYIGDENLSKLILFEDATSPVKGFESIAYEFKEEMVSKGMRISNTREFIAHQFI